MRERVFLLSWTIANPRPGEVYKLGGGRGNSCSILEAFHKVEQITGLPMRYEYCKQNREGDHVCYMSDLAKIRSHYPAWHVTKSLDVILEETVAAWSKRMGVVHAS